MRTLWNTLWSNGGLADMLVTTQAIYQFYETDVDPDFRYDSSDIKVADRGFGMIKFKGMPLMYSAKVTADVIYMFDSKNLFMVNDTAWDFEFDPFVKPSDSKTRSSLFANRCNVMTNRRRGSGKLTSVVA